jgi:hypothetical protein
MSVEKTGRYCKHCKSKVPAERKATNHVLHLLISVFTAGLWLPLWFACSLKIGGWRCVKCGSKC